MWSLFLASSWTWCIGLFLPFVLMQRFGWPAFFAFAIPNVLGCSAFGYVIRNRQRSRALVGEHEPAMLVFSLIAIAYHMLFIALLAAIVPGDWSQMWWAGIVAAAGVLIMGWFIGHLEDEFWLPLALIMFLMAIAAFAAVRFDAVPEIRAQTPRQLSQLLWMMPVIWIGFLLCPHLDLTFHRALQSARTRHAFAGFGVLFAFMIVLTPLIWHLQPRVLPFIALAHILGQSTFTVGAHMRELRTSPRLKGKLQCVVLLPLLAAGLVPGVQHVVRSADPLADTTMPVVNTYVRFLVFYAHIFPAYVLIFMGPWKPAKRTVLSQIALFAILIALAPLYELGFLHGQGFWLAIPALAVVLWALARRRAA